MPILAGAGQPTHLQAENQPDVVERDLGQQPLEPRPPLDRLTALSEVVVDDHDALAGPAELDRSVRQGVLAGGRLLMIVDLLQCGLADIIDGPALEMPGLYFGGSQDFIHDRPPRGAVPRGVGRGVVRAGRGVVASCRQGCGSKGSPLPGSGSAPAWSCAGGSGVSCGVGHVIPPCDSVRRCRHHSASSSSAETAIVTCAMGSVPPLA